MVFSAKRPSAISTIQLLDQMPCRSGTPGFNQMVGSSLIGSLGPLGPPGAPGPPALGV
jgi:hypothetical protein